ncbi:hypothetical protein [Nostoc sp.]
MREQVDAPHQKPESSTAPTAWRIYGYVAKPRAGLVEMLLC